MVSSRLVSMRRLSVAMSLAFGAVLLAGCEKAEVEQAQVAPQAAPVEQAAAQPAAPQQAATAPESQRVTLAKGLYELAYSPSQDAVFVASSGGFGQDAGPSQVLRLDPNTLEVQVAIALERKAFGIALDDAAGRLYVGNTVDTSVTVIDIAENKPVGLVQLQEKTKGEDGKERYTHDLRELVVDAEKNRLYVTGHSFDGSVLFVVNTDTLQVERAVEGLGKTKAPGLTLDAEEGRVFASNLFGEIMVIDTDSLEVTRRLQTEMEQPMNLVYDAPTKRLFATDQGLGMIRDMQDKLHEGFESKHPGNRVGVLDVDSGELVHSIPVGEGPLALTLDRSRDRLYVTEREGGTVSAYDSNTYEKLGTVQLGTHPNSLALDERNGVVYVSIKNGDADPKGSDESLARVRF